MAMNRTFAQVARGPEFKFYVWRFFIYDHPHSFVVVAENREAAMRKVLSGKFLHEEGPYTDQAPFIPNQYEQEAGVTVRKFTFTLPLAPGEEYPKSKEVTSIAEILQQKEPQVYSLDHAISFAALDG